MAVFKPDARRAEQKHCFTWKTSEGNQVILGTFKPLFGGSLCRPVVAQLSQAVPFIQHFKSEVTAFSGTLAQTILLVAWPFISDCLRQAIS